MTIRGRSLRPAEPLGRPIRVGRPLRAAWSECTQRAGYVRASKYSSQTRAVYPTTPHCGVNPAISVNHFVVPAPLARELGLRRVRLVNASAIPRAAA